MTLDRLRTRLDRYLAQRSMQPFSGLVALTGGFASSLYLGECGGAHATRVVLKTYAPDARGRAHATREWHALTRLREVDYAVPRGILLEPDARHLGRPFIVMEHLRGAPLWGVYEAADSIERARLVQLYAAQLVALHILDPRVLAPAAPTRPFRYLDHELERLRRDSANSPHAALAKAVRWLEARMQTVPCERPVILHRDFHPWNVLVDAASRLWVIDWDWRIGDARFDLAWTCMLMRRSDHHGFSTAVRDVYARQSGRALDGLEYFEVLTTVRWLLNVLASAESDTQLDAAARADFRAFLVEPVRRAQAFLEERTGISPRIWT